jgi:hypothetical protein
LRGIIRPPKITALASRRDDTSIVQAEAGGRPNIRWGHRKRVGRDFEQHSLAELQSEPRAAVNPNDEDR